MIGVGASARPICELLNNYPLPQGPYFMENRHLCAKLSASESVASIFGTEDTTAPTTSDSEAEVFAESGSGDSSPPLVGCPPVLAYGPHGSPKRGNIATRPCATPTPLPIASMGSTRAKDEVLAYGPHGSPKKRGTRPRAAPSHPVATDVPFEAMRSGAKQQVFAYGPHDSPKRNGVMKQQVFAYGPHGSPKRRAAAAKLGHLLPESVTPPETKVMTTGRVPDDFQSEWQEFDAEIDSLMTEWNAQLSNGAPYPGIVKAKCSKVAAKTPSYSLSQQQALNHVAFALETGKRPAVDFRPVMWEERVAKESGVIATVPPTEPVRRSKVAEIACQIAKSAGVKIPAPPGLSLAPTPR